METVRRLGEQDVVERVPRVVVGKLVGLAIVTILPALFWTGVLAVIGSTIGIAFSAGTLLLIGVAIALMLSLVFTALTLSAGGGRRGSR